MAQQQQVYNNEIIIISDDEGEGDEYINLLTDSEKNMDTGSDNEQCCFRGTCNICSEENLEEGECCFEDSCYICSEENLEETEGEENNQEHPGFRIENGEWGITLTFGETDMTFNSSNRDQLTRFVILFLHEIGILQFFDARYY